MSETVEKAEQVAALTENVSGNPLRRALQDLSLLQIRWTLVGGLAVGFHAKPRGTQDIDIMVLSDKDIDEIASSLSDKFRQYRKHALEHKDTGVEVKLLTPEFLSVPRQIISQIIDTASVEQGIPVASREGIIAAKLLRSSRQDEADIEAILKAGGPADLSDFNLTDSQLQAYRVIAASALGDAAQIS